MSDENIVAPRKPPNLINGIEYEYLEDDRLCQSCGNLVLANQVMVRRNARGRVFSDILPLKNGICLSCGADGLSTMSVNQYENILKQVNNYESLAEKKKITDSEKKHMKILETYIENLQQFTEELGNFVEYTESNGVKYYDAPEEESDEQ